MQKTLLAVIAAAVVSVGLSVNFALGAGGEPADKASVTGSDVLVSGPGEDVELLRTTMRTSTTADSTLGVTLECAIATSLKTVGDDDQNANGVVDVWVEIDDVPVPVSGEDDGRITFCNESHRRKTSGFDDTGQADDTIETFDASKAANSFNWTALNMGNGIHDIVVKAELTETASNDATADAAIGRRTLTISPTHMAVNETSTSGDD